MLSVIISRGPACGLHRLLRTADTDLIGLKRIVLQLGADFAVVRNSSFEQKLACKRHDINCILNWL